MQIGPKIDPAQLKFRIGPLVGWLIRITPTCRDIVRLISDDMDHPLPLGTRLKIRVHFLICKWCDRYRRQLLFMRNALRRHPDRLAGAEPPADSPGLSSDARERIKRTLQDRSE